MSQQYVIGYDANGNALSGPMAPPQIPLVVRQSVAAQLGVDAAFQQMRAANQAVEAAADVTARFAPTKLPTGPRQLAIASTTAHTIVPLQRPAVILTAVPTTARTLVVAVRPAVRTFHPTVHLVPTLRSGPAG